MNAHLDIAKHWLEKSEVAESRDEEQMQLLYAIAHGQLAIVEELEKVNRAVLDLGESE